MDAREGALRILYNIEVDGAYSNIALNKEFKKNTYTKLDRNFITELVYGTLENLIFIDYIIEGFSNIKLNKMDPWVLNLIRLAIYQMLFLDKIPDFAAVNESVNLSKKYCKKASGFVNGLLRNVVRKKNDIRMPDKEKEYEKYLSVKYSHPQWMVKRFLKNFSKDFTEELLKANNKTPKLYIRVNTLKTTVEEVMDFLKENNIEVEKSPYISEALIVDTGFSQLEEFDIYQKGFIHIQDFSSMLVGKILDPQEGDFVIDVCSAPGGKSTYIAELMQNKGKILARDIHGHKLKLIQRNVKRLGIDIIDVEGFDATDLDHKLLDKADKVLVDAPCSGLGIIRRKPEIKYRKDISHIENMVKTQTRILHNAAKYVKKGGKLVYSTCTIDPDENSHVVEDFLKKNPEFKLIQINKIYNKVIPGEHRESMIQLYPNLHQVDGFFIAKLKKN